MEIHLNDFDHCQVLRSILETSDVTGGGKKQFRYQSSYLTIKASDEFGYTLGIPNEEVRQALWRAKETTHRQEDRGGLTTEGSFRNWGSSFRDWDRQR